MSGILRKIRMGYCGEYVVSESSVTVAFMVE